MEKVIIENNTIEWFLKLIRIAGVSFPGAASLVQFQAEIDSMKFAAQLKELKDPISSLHIDIPAVSKEIYGALSQKDSLSLYFEEEFYVKYSRALAILNKKRFISKSNIIGSRIPIAIRLIDPSFIMYMCAQTENNNKMNEIVNLVEICEPGKWIDGEKLKSEICLPKYVIRAVFEIYESKGYGILSNIINSCKYMGNA